MPSRRAKKAAKAAPKAEARKWVYLFAGGKAEGSAKMRALLGGKGAGLAEMTNAGIPVPPGFTITTAACNAYFEGGGKMPPGLWDQVERGLATVELLGAEEPVVDAVALARAARPRRRRDRQPNHGDPLEQGLNHRSFAGARGAGDDEDPTASG